MSAEVPVPPTLPTTVAGLARRAAEVLAAGPLEYYNGGAGDEVTLSDNETSWTRYAIRPRVLVDVSERDLSTTILGRTHPHPILVAPTAYQRYATDAGEAATARAAAETGTTMCLSSQTTTSPDAVCAAAPGAPRWFQLYVFKDRAVTADLVAAARDGGFEALVLTVDFPVGGLRHRDEQTGFSLDLPVPSSPGGGTRSPASAHGMHDPSLTWDDVERLAAESGLPVVVKGVLRPDDARLAVRSGASGVIVSNHGGRQLDTVVSGLDALQPVVQEVGSETDVLVDGGIRRGSDIVKAMALGARGVLVGRPVLWGLAAGGESGARRALEILTDELDNALALAGCARVSDLDPSWVQPAPWSHGAAR